jgi:adenylosuccinate lyase
MMPDVFHLVHYMTNRLNSLLEGLYVDVDRMYANTQTLGGVLYSSHLLLHLVEKHRLSREAAYSLVQRLAHDLSNGQHLQDAITSDKEARKYFTSAELQIIFSGKKHLKAIETRLKHFLKD